MNVTLVGYRWPSPQRRRLRRWTGWQTPPSTQARTSSASTKLEKERASLDARTSSTAPDTSADISTATRMISRTKLLTCVGNTGWHHHASANKGCLLFTAWVASFNLIDLWKLKTVKKIEMKIFIYIHPDWYIFCSTNLDKILPNGIRYTIIYRIP